MQFEVNGQIYILAMLVPDGDLGLFAPTPSGLKRVPIINDDHGYVWHRDAQVAERDRVN